MGAVIRPRGRVLVVDDDAVICDLVASTLAEHGYATRKASDAREALYLVQREIPDVVLLDVRLPDISGYQVCRRLREDLGDRIGIILLSGERKESLDRAAGLLLGADDYMVKPFVLDELLARVQRLAKRTRPIARTVVAGRAPPGRRAFGVLTRARAHTRSGRHPRPASRAGSRA